MAKGKRTAIQNRTPRTRSRFKKVDDPVEAEKSLCATLKEMGLYASTTLGDGNCMFRALSDQYFGNPDSHQKIRQDVCDYLETHDQEYMLFVDSPDLEPKEAFERHVALMRQNATYGSHLELSVFARMVKRSIKVIQPGLIYLLGDEDESPAALKQRQQEQARRLAEKGKGRETEEHDTYPLYIIYHGSYEHYSSARQIKGPHSGKPEITIADNPSSSSSKSPDHRSGTLIPTAEEKLVLSSLPNPEAHSIAEVRKLIDSTGSWEAALEALQEEDASPPSETIGEDDQATIDSDQSSPLSSTPSSPLASASPLPPLAAEDSRRPASPKRSLSESLHMASLNSTPPTKNPRRASTRLAQLASEADERRSQPSSRSSSPTIADISEETGTPLTDGSDFEDVDSGVDEEVQKEKEEKKEERYSLRSRNRTKTVVGSGKERRAAAKAVKHQQRLQKMGRTRAEGREVPSIRELHI